MTAGSRSVEVKVGGTSRTFTAFEDLKFEADVQRQAIRSIEAESLTVNPRDVEAWRRLERRAADLLAVLSAMDAWIDADNADLDAEIEAARAVVRQI